MTGVHAEGGTERHLTSHDKVPAKSRVRSPTTLEQTAAFGWPRLTVVPFTQTSNQLPVVSETSTPVQLPAWPRRPLRTGA